jgi:muramoyltetrapeptide carboxypeptidase
VAPRTRAGLVKFRPVRPGSRVAIVAPASPFGRADFDAGLAELRRLYLEPVYDERIFAEHPIVAGPASVRAEMLKAAMTNPDVDAVIAARGGYGSMEVLPYLEAPSLRRARTAFVGYSDTTALHAFLNGHVRMASVHGAMVEGRLAKGAGSYDLDSFLSSLGPTPLGEMAPEGLDVIRPGEAVGPILGGTLTQLTSSLGTPYEFIAPPRHVLFLEDVGERPYRIRRMLTQLRQSGRLSGTAAIVFGPMLRCDEPGGRVTIRDVVAEFAADFPGPVVFGFPSGHTETPSVSIPFGVETRVIATGTPRLVFTEAAAE